MCKKLIFLFSFLFVLVSVSSMARAATEVWFEAEAADPLTLPYEVLADAEASGGEYINTVAGTAYSTTSSPAPDGTASFVFDADAGTYKVVVRVKIIEGVNSYDNDSLWVRIDSGAWINFNGIDHAGNVWHWAVVHDYDAGSPYPQVEFTLDAGQHVLEISYRETDCYVDAVLITDDLAVNPSTLPDEIPSGGDGCVEENILTNGSFEDGFAEPWVFDNATPTYEIVGDAQDGDKALKVTIDAPGSEEYIPALAHKALNFEDGKYYTFSVFLKGSYEGMQVFLKPQHRGGGWTGYGAEYKTLTTEWAEYSVTTPVFSGTQPYENDVSIWLGMQAGEIYVDHARFYEGDYVAPCAPDGGAPVTLDLQISEGNDDVEEAVGAGTVYLDSSDLEIVYDDYVGDNQIIGLRFQGVSIPYGATITSAYVEFECDEVKDNDPVNVVINGELAADAAAFTSTDYDVSNRTLTAAQASWSIPNWAVDGKSQSADISAVIQEIVDQGGWASGNALVLIIQDDSSNPSTGTRTAEAYEGEEANAPSLHIVYTKEGPPPAVVKATKPEPASGTSDLTRFNMLSWTPGDYADSHNVYLGTDKQVVTDATVDDPMGVLVSQQQPNAFYDAAGDYGTTYYWRVDEVNEADMTIYPGDVWFFSTKPIGPIIPQASITVTASSQKDEDQGPEKTIDSSGLTGFQHGSTDKTTMWLSDSTSEPNKAWIRYDFDKVYKMPRMLIWNYNLSGISSGYAIKGVTIEYSSDGGQNWFVLPEPNELPQGTGTDTYGPLIVDLGGVVDGLAINAFRITANSNYRSVFKNYGLSEVKFYYIPVWPTNPNPADKATGVSVVNPKLTWTTGEGAVEHKVYFGTDEMAVTDGTVTPTVLADTSFTPPPLTLGTLYYWRVVEVNNASVPSDWSGPTWSFTASTYTVVDDFEGSSLKWSSGSSSSGNGAAVSLDTAIKNGGSQSMKFMFDDTSTQGYSETSANPGQLASGSNWTIGGPTCLVFQVYGDLDNITTERLYVKLNDATYWYNQDLIPDSELVTPWWTQVQIPLIADQVTLNNVNSLKIGFIRTDSKTGTGEIHIDDVRLYATAPTPLLPVNPGDANLVAWYKMQNNANDSAPAPKINGTAIGEPNYVDGPYPGYGKAMEFYGDDDVVDLGPADPFNFTGSFSVSFWVNIQAATNSKFIATRGEADGFSVNIRSGGFGSWLRFTTQGISQGGFFGVNQYVSPLPTVGEWTHVVCTYNTDDPNNATKTVYYNGVQMQQVAVTGSLLPSTSNASLGGGANADNTGFDSLFKGNLDDVRFYNKVLTAGEMKFLIDPTP